MYLVLCWKVTTKGAVRRTGTTLLVDFDNLERVEEWGGAPVGIAGRFYPKPTEWTLGGCTLEKTTVKSLTAVTRALTARLTAEILVAPSCIEAITSMELEGTRIGSLPHDIGARYNNDTAAKTRAKRFFHILRNDRPPRTGGHRLEEHRSVAFKLDVGFEGARCVLRGRAPGAIALNIFSWDRSARIQR